MPPGPELLGGEGLGGARVDHPGANDPVSDPVLHHPQDPVTAESRPPVPDSSSARIDEAVGSVAAVPRAAWAGAHRRRAAVLRAWANLIAADEGLPAAIVLETGKPIREARTEVAGSVDALLFNAGLCRLPLGTAGSLPDGTEAHLVREPVGPHRLHHAVELAGAPAAARSRARLRGRRHRSGQGVTADRRGPRAGRRARVPGGRAARGAAAPGRGRRGRRGAGPPPDHPSGGHHGVQRGGSGGHAGGGRKAGRDQPL